jgi:hypothetical protein
MMNQVFAELRRIAPFIHLVDAEVRAGFVDVGTVPQVLGEGLLRRGVLVQVEPASSERVWVVASAAGVVGEGVSVDGGDRHFWLPANNLNQIWLVAEADVRVQFWGI